MNEKYTDGEGSKKEFLKKQKKNNRKIKQKVSSSRYNITDEESSYFDEYEDMEFEKFSTSKKQKR